MEGRYIANVAFEDETTPETRLRPPSPFIQRLPDEILRKILQEAFPSLRRPKGPFDKLDEPLQSDQVGSNKTFEYLTHPHFVRMILSVVCRRWRHLIMGMRSIWSVYQLDHSLVNFKPEMLERWISLSKGHPLEVLTTPHKWLVPDSKVFYRILRRHSGRLRVYVAEFSRLKAPSPLGIFAKRPRTSTVELPYLEEFIVDSGDHELPIKISAPKLRILGIGRFFDMFTDESFKNLSEWTLNTRLSRSHTPINTIDLDKKLTLCHSLLSFRADTTNFWLERPSGVMLHSVQELRLIGRFTISPFTPSFVPNIEILVVASLEPETAIPQWLHQLLNGLNKLRRLTLENFSLTENLSPAARLDGVELRNCRLDGGFYQVLTQRRNNLQFLVLDNCDFPLEGLLCVLQALSVSGSILLVLIRHNQDIIRKCKDELKGFPSVVLLESSFKTGNWISPHFSRMILF